MPALQRMRQGVRALLAFTRPVDYALAARYLNDDQLRLFGQMRRSEKLHSLNVLRDALSTSAEMDTAAVADLATASLLHDVGKARYPLAIWQKTLAVLVRSLLPGVYRRWSTGTPAHPLQRACVVAENHPAWSAELVGCTGASERVLWLIAHHADALSRWPQHPHRLLLEYLKRADDAN